MALVECLDLSNGFLRLKVFRQYCGQFFGFGFECADQKPCLLVVYDVASYFLAEYCRIAECIEPVVAELECHAKGVAVAVEGLCGGFVGMCHNGAEAACATEKYRCLQPYHKEILVNCHILTLLEFHVELLSFVYLHGRAVEAFREVGKAVAGFFGQLLCGHSEHGVA